MVEITPNYHVTSHRPHSLWAISLANVREFLKWHVPGVERAGIDAISHSDPWHARMTLYVGDSW